jgi:hypothetical protein
VRGERRRCHLPTTDPSADPCHHTQDLADLYKNWKAWIRTKDLAREASPAIRSYLKAEFAKLRNSGILTISEVKLGVLTTFLAQFGVMLRSVATSSCITNGFVRAGLCSRVAGVAVAGPNIEKMLMTCARATDPSIYKAMYDGLPLIFPEINRCGGCDDEMLLNVGKFPQDVDSKGRLVPLRKYGPLSGSDNRHRTKNLSHSAQTADRELQIMKAVEEKQNALNDVHAKVVRTLLTCMCACMRAG